MYVCVLRSEAEEVWAGGKRVAFLRGNRKREGAAHIQGAAGWRSSWGHYDLNDQTPAWIRLNCLLKSYKIMFQQNTILRKHVKKEKGKGKPLLVLLSSPLQNGWRGDCPSRAFSGILSV